MLPVLRGHRGRILSVRSGLTDQPGRSAVVGWYTRDLLDVSPWLSALGSRPAMGNEPPRGGAKHRPCRAREVLLARSPTREAVTGIFLHRLFALQIVSHQMKSFGKLGNPPPTAGRGVAPWITEQYPSW